MSGVRRMIRRLIQRLGWRETRTFISLPAPLLAGAYELAVEVPEGVVLTRVRVISLTPGIPTARIRQTGRLALIEIEDAGPGWWGYVEVDQRAESAYPLAVFLTAATVALVLSGGLLRLRSLAESPEAAGAILLAIPALFATLVAQPGRGTPAARLLTGARVVLVLTGVLAYIAAVMLVFYPSDAARPRLSPALDLFWFVDMIVAWSLVGLLTLPLFGPQLQGYLRRAPAWPDYDGLMGVRT
jgi:hypothetical protein